MKFELLLFFLFSSILSWGQSNTRKYINLHVDDSVIYKVTDSLLSDKTNEVIVFQTLKPFDYMKSNDSLITFIIWKQKDSFETIIITNTKIYPAITFNGNDIFSYKKKRLTYVTKDEEGLNFVPPIMLGNVVYFLTKTTANYFELTGSNTQPWTYKPNNELKEKARSEYFEIIYKSLLNSKFNSEIKDNYLRKL